MSYLTIQQIRNFGFKKFGQNVKISQKASIYNPEEIELGDHVRIDDFCVLSGRIKIGKYVHITPMCLLAGGTPGLVVDDFSTFAYGVKAFTQSDDYSGASMCNSLVPKRYKNEIFLPTKIGRQVIIGAGAIVMPGANIAEGCAIGAMSLINKPTQPWGIYVGSPARRIKERSKELLDLEEIFLKEIAQ